MADLKTYYVVAVSQKEAEAYCDRIGWTDRKAAERHLAEVKAPPTDPFYAAQYKIWEVRHA